MRRLRRSVGPALLLRGLTVDRHRPRIGALASENDPELFVWRILPHAARSFGASIVVLPERQALASAVAYLYCRMLDTYEDLIDDRERSVAELARFADRFESDRPPPATTLPESVARDRRDLVYLLLIERCELVDRVYLGLPAPVRQQISELVRSMSDGMIWSKEAFARQGGVLVDREQLALYCRNVIGYPALFTLAQVADRELTPSAREDAFLVSEMIQLANVTRDIERDLARGIAYHPALKEHLGRSGYDDASRPVVNEVRAEFMAMAMSRAPAYRRLFEGLELGGTVPVRTAAVLMLLFTDLHYRGCALRTGNATWPGPRGSLQVVASTFPSVLSRAWAGHTIRRVEHDFLDAGTVIAGSPG